MARSLCKFYHILTGNGGGGVTGVGAAFFGTATGIPERDYSESFDTVNVCFSKGLGAPVGSALAGSRTEIERARRFKQQYGGGMRQAGILAAAALFALEHHRDELPSDVSKARTFAEGLSTIEGVSVDLDGVQSNIVRFDVAVDAGDFATACHERGVYMLPNGAHGIRAILHRDVATEQVAEALRILAEVLEEQPATVTG